MITIKKRTWKVCGNCPSNSCRAILTGPTYFLTPCSILFAASWFISSSTVFRFRLKTNLSTNLAWPPIRTHWSTNTVISFPVTENIDLVNVFVFQTMLLQALGSALVWRALDARASSLFRTWRSCCWPNLKQNSVNLVNSGTLFLFKELHQVKI